MALSNYTSITHNNNNFAASQYPSSNTKSYSSNVAVTATAFTNQYGVLNFAGINSVTAATSQPARPKSGMMFPRYVR